MTKGHRMAKTITIEAGDFGVDRDKLVKFDGKQVTVLKNTGQVFAGALEVRESDFRVLTGKRGRPPVFHAVDVDEIVVAA